MIMPARAPSPDPASESRPLPPSVRELRRVRARRLLVRFALGVGLPTLLAILYYGLLASPQYDSVAVLAVDSTDGRVAERGRGPGGNAQDARLLRQYLQSRSIFELLAREQGLVAHYQDDRHDWWSRLAGGAGADEAFRYFRDKVVVTGEGASSVLELRVRAFTPEVAQQLAGAIVANAEAWTFELGERARRERIEPAEREVSRARARMAEARAAMLQATGGVDVDPEATTDPAVLEHELARLSLAAALEGLGVARLDAQRAQRHLMVIATPSLPDRAARPRPAWDIATVFVTALVLVAVLSLLGAAVREHANL
jgi:capsular polysaccharide transport system permease protein